MTRLGFLLASFALVLPACIDDPCDPGFYAIRGSCFPDPIDAATTDTGEDGDAGEDSDGGEVDDAPACEAPFGADCTNDAQCGCGTVCIPMINICSAFQCQGGDVCPDDPGWSCLDISAMSPDPAITHLCFGG